MKIKGYETSELNVRMEKINGKYCIMFTKHGKTSKQYIHDFETANVLFNNLINLKDLYIQKA